MSDAYKKQVDSLYVEMECSKYDSINDGMLDGLSPKKLVLTFTAFDWFDSLTPDGRNQYMETPGIYYFIAMACHAEVMECHGAGALRDWFPEEMAKTGV